MALLELLKVRHLTENGKNVSKLEIHEIVLISPL